MTDTIKLIIEIPKVVKADIDNGVIRRNIDKIYLALANGIPLDSNSEQTEVQAYFDGQAYGWEEGRKALIDEVKAEIRNCEIRHDFRIAEKDTKSRELMHGIFSDVYGVISRIGKAESEEK